MKRIIHYYLNLGLRKKLMLNSIMIAIIPMIILGIFSYSKSKEFIERQALNDMENHAIQIATNISSRLEKDNEFIRITALSPSITEDVGINRSILEMTTASNKYFEPMMWYNLTLNKDLRAVTIYYEDLEQQIGSFFLPASQVDNESLYRETIKHKDTLWTVSGDNLKGTRRIFDITSQTAKGAIFVDLDFEHIMSDVIPKTNSNYGLMILDSKDKVAHIRAVNNHDLNDSLYKDIKDTSEKRIKFEDEQYFRTQIDIPNLDWELIYFVSADNYYKGVNEIAKMTIGLIALCLIIMFVLVVILTRFIVERIASLIESMKAAETGDLSLKVHSEYEDEIGQLTNQFGQMLQRLNRLIEESYKNKLTLKELELKALQSQINPHFLYNTLSLINWKAIDIESHEISEIARKLSMFFRTSLNNGQATITLDNELKNAKAYIDIQLIMHDYDFEVIYDIDESLLNHHIINFIIQPIVENAIMHGLDEDEDESKKKVLTIVLKRNENQVYLSVSDNGCGMEQNVVDSLLEHESSGYGIKNVNQRLALFYEDYTFEITSKIGHGTTIVLKTEIF